jgi:DNA processing protein
MAGTNIKTSIHMQKITLRDKCYPTRLKDLFDPPDPLYIKGNFGLLDLPMIAIVGSRKASPQGLKHATRFAQELSAAGALVISGLAKGVDGAAHRGALGEKSHPLTAAICGTGLDIVYPREHQSLANEIGRRGLLISELPPGVGPKAFHFPRRNRIIAALAMGVVVIEAAEKSGSLITAHLAAELGREVFALPGPIDDPLFTGSHQLIQAGAKLVCRPKDVLEELIFFKNCI